MPPQESYANAVRCVSEALSALGPNAKVENPAVYHLAMGVCRMAEGLVESERMLAMRLAAIETGLRRSNSS